MRKYYWRASLLGGNICFVEKKVSLNQFTDFQKSTEEKKETFSFT